MRGRETAMFTSSAPSPEWDRDPYLGLVKNELLTRTLHIYGSKHSIIQPRPHNYLLHINKTFGTKIWRTNLVIEKCTGMEYHDDELVENTQALEWLMMKTPKLFPYHNDESKGKRDRTQ